MGSIAHLTSAVSFGGVPAPPDLSPAEQLAKFVAEAGTESPFPIVAVFCVDNVDSLIEDRGTAFINESLAQLFAAIKEVLPSTSQIGQIQTTEFAAITTIDHSSAEEMTRQTIALALEKCNGLATFSAGLWIDPPVDGKSIDGDQSELKREHAMEYARYAAADARRTGNAVTIFSANVAAGIMRHSHGKQLYRQAIEDYRAFRKMGVDYSSVENLAAVSAFSVGDSEKELMLSAGKRAVELEPSHSVFLSNLGIYQYRLNDKRTAYSNLAKAQSTSTSYAPSEAVRRVFAMSAYADYIAGGEVDPSTLLRLLEESKTGTKTYFDIGSNEIENAIADVTMRMVAPTAEDTNGSETDELIAEDESADP